MSTAFRVFVPRTRQLERLSALLDRALAGEGQVAFVAGEAGSGKSTLIQAFTRQAQERNPDLLVVFGDCNAQTGAGDPYLPFREVLGQLTGEVDAGVAEGVITQENARRLKAFLRESGDLLIDVGADVLGIFVPGASLLAKVGAKLLGRGGERGGGALGQKQIFEQYTEIVRRLTQHRPLIILLDDLHWADGASIDLLFHLSRRIEGSRVLVIGTYRPQDVAVGRDGERHPLDPVIAELKRYYGDTVIGVEQSDTGEQRRFLDALLDSQPNQLDAEFRSALLRHTEGHPLFTVELLRSFQEQGVLVVDGEGLRLAGPVNWETLPSRVEGVIEARIGRLEQSLREMLTIGSVEGQTFAGEVVARVQRAAEREVIRQLSSELEKHHQLVSAQGAERIGSARISYYRFRHNLFQKYLYGTLDPVERSYLHDDVGHVLEELYGERAATIAVQLAHHFGVAGEAERAAYYEELAGDAAAAVYAYNEARLHYESSLQRLESLDDSVATRRRRVSVTIKIARVSYLGASPAKTLAYLREVEPVAAALPAEMGGGEGDPLLLARVQYWIGRYLFLVNAPREAIAWYRKVLDVAPSLGDPELLALPSSVIGRALVSQGYFSDAVPMLRQAVEPLETMGNTLEWIHTLNFLCSALAGRGDIEEALRVSERALTRAREIRSPTALSLSYIHLWAAQMQTGDPDAMLETAQTLVASASEPGDPVALYVGLGFLAWSQALARQFPEAQASMRRCRTVAAELGTQLVIADWFAAVDAEIALGLGQPAEAAELAERAVELARSLGGVFGEARAQRVWALALAEAGDADVAEVDAHLEAAVRAAEAGGARPELARVQRTWGELCERRGDVPGAVTHYRLAADTAPAGMAAEWRDAVAARLSALASRSAEGPLP